MESAERAIDDDSRSEEVRVFGLAELLGFLLIGFAAGWLAGRIMKGRGFGLLGNLIVGVIGALLGGFLFNLIGLAAYGLVARLLMAVIGSVVLLYLISFIRKP